MMRIKKNFIGIATELSSFLMAAKVESKNGAYIQKFRSGAAIN